MRTPAAVTVGVDTSTVDPAGTEATVASDRTGVVVRAVEPFQDTTTSSQTIVGASGPVTFSTWAWAAARTSPTAVSSADDAAGIFSAPFASAVVRSTGYPSRARRRGGGRRVGGGRRAPSARRCGSWCSGPGSPRRGLVGPVEVSRHRVGVPAAVSGQGRRSWRGARSAPGRARKVRHGVALSRGRFGTGGGPGSRGHHPRWIRTSARPSRSPRPSCRRPHRSRSGTGPP